MSKYHKKALSKISIESSIKTFLIMNDYDNWENGEYKGDIESINNQTKTIIRIIERGLKRGSPLGIK